MATNRRPDFTGFEWNIETESGEEQTWLLSGSYCPSTQNTFETPGDPAEVEIWDAYNQETKETITFDELIKRFNLNESKVDAILEAIDVYQCENVDYGDDRDYDDRDIEDFVYED